MVVMIVGGSSFYWLNCNFQTDVALSLGEGPTHYRRAVLVIFVMVVMVMFGSRDGIMLVVMGASAIIVLVLVGASFVLVPFSISMTTHSYLAKPSSLGRCNIIIIINSIPLLCWCIL